ncbi:hypothetical protein GGF46_001090 [Coemansia sp. RSA 552]|nr:hypothetical protein GGF46_001090 [Coemansia sp. RSA 552]
MSAEQNDGSSAREPRPRPHSPEDAAPADTTKRRRVSGDAPSADSTADRGSSGWSFELCSGTDETLQISRLSCTESRASRSSENALDSYRLETLVSAERDQPRADGEDDARWCSAIVSAQHVAIIVGSQIHILKADCRTQEAVIYHDSHIQVAALNHDSSFVAFGDEAGVLYIVHIRTRRPVFSQSIRQPGNGSACKQPAAVDALCFAVSGSAEKLAREELVVVASHGHAVRFSNIELCLLSQAILDGNMALAAEIKSKIDVEPLSLHAGKQLLHGGGISGLALFHTRGHSLLFVSGSGDASLSCWRRDENQVSGNAPATTQLADVVTSECAGSGYTKIQLSLDQRHLVALSEHGVLDVYELSTLTLVFRYLDVAIDDFGLSISSASHSSSSASLSMLVVALSKPIYPPSDSDHDEDDACRKLLVFELPSMATTYSMDVSAWSWLAQDTRALHDVSDSILFIEGTIHDGVQCLYLRSLCETVPLERLSHFLRTGRYTEAEAFAETHGIPLSVVYRKRLEELQGNPDHPLLSGLDGEEAVSQFVAQTLEMLGHIEDCDFAANLCVGLSVPSLPGTQALLAYAFKAATGASRHTGTVRDAIQRLGTWTLISDSSDADSPGFDHQGWAVFRTTNLASYVRSYIAQGDIPRVGAVWRRHRHDEQLQADIPIAIQGFRLDSIDVKALTSWLRAEVLPTLRTREQWQAIATWAEQGARMLESRTKQPTAALCLVDLLDSDTWPTVPNGSAGLQPATSALSLTPRQFMEGSIRAAKWTAGLSRFCGQPLRLSAQDAQQDPNADPVSQSCMFLRTQLLDLVRLRDQHSMVLSLEEYEQFSYSTISIEFLDRVAAPELLPAAYFSHFLPYTECHALDHAQILQSYCIDVMNAADLEASERATNAEDGIDAPDTDMVSSRGHHSWEPRVLQLLSCLYASIFGQRDASGQGLLDSTADAEKTMPPLTTSRLGLLKTFFDIVLEAMRRSTIPWSSAIDTVIGRILRLLDRHADIDPDMSQARLEIREQFRLMCLKRMLLSHGLPDFHISNVKMAYPLLQWLARKTDSDGVMPDILQLVDAYHHLSRVSAYVLRLQALCETCEPEKVSALIGFIDSTEHGGGVKGAPPADSSTPAQYALQASTCSGGSHAKGEARNGSSDQAHISKYVPLEVARRGICWIREVLDSMGFAGEPSRAQFRQLAGGAMAMLRTLEDLAAKYEQSTHLHHNRTLARHEQEKLRAFIAAETSVLGVAWQLLVDGGIMVSPGELEQQSTREQILAELLDQQWLRPYTEPSSQPAAVIGLPLLPANVKALATMLRFSQPQLSLRIVKQCLFLGLYTMALDMCQQLVGALQSASNDVSPAASLACGSRSSEWTAAINALSACERGIGLFLAELAEDSGDRGPSLSAELHGVLVRRLVNVCQAASLKCATQPHLVSFLDSHSCWTFARAVFDQTNDGDFAALTRGPSAMPAPSSSFARAASSSSIAESAGTSSRGSQDISPSGWSAALYINLYAERGLVLDTKRSMDLVYRLISALRRLPTAGLEHQAPDPSLAAANVPATGKAKAASGSSGKEAAQAQYTGNSDDALLDALDPEAIRAEAVRRCRELVGYLARNKHWVLAVQAFELAVSQLARSSFVIEGDVLSASAGDSLTMLRQRLSSGGVDEGELETLLDMNASSATATASADISELASRSLVRSLQQHGLDAVFIFSCMLLAPPIKAYQHLSTSMSHSGLLPSRVVSLANIGAACSLVWQQQALLDRCRSVAAAARWSEQLQLLELKFDVALLSDPKPELLEPLVRPMLIRTSMDITTLLEFAEAFRLDETFVVLEYISLCCSAPHVDSYQARVLGIADEVANSKLLERTYVDALESCISCYDYERLQFVVQRLQDLRPEDRAIARYGGVLDVLCSYDRKSQPTLEELSQEWSRTRAARDAIRQMGERGDSSLASSGSSSEKMSYSDLLAAYPLASKRLPFHGIANTSPWKTLLPELMPDTVDMLLPLAQPLELSEDDFYMNLIDGILRQWRAGGAAGQEGNIGVVAAYELATSKTPTRFNAIQHLLRCFKDPESAISTIKHIADEFPCGPDRVAALKMGTKLLYKWGQYIKRMQEPERSQMTAKAEAIYVHFEKSYTDTKVEIELRRNGLEVHLAHFAAVQDADSAVHVLAAIFEAECAGVGALQAARPNGKASLHEVLRNLAAIYDIGLETLMRRLLDRYLEAAIEVSEDVDEPLLPSMRYQALLRRQHSPEATLRQRIMCILHTYPMADAVQLLLEFAYSGKGGASCLCRARALEILFSLATHADIAQLQQPEDVYRYFQALLYLADFDFVGIPQSTADFLDCEKPALARSVWIEHHQDPKAIQLVCNMCLDFDVRDRDLLLHMLPRLLAERMFRYVIGVLDSISAVECYSTVEELPVFWNQAVLGFLLRTSRTEAPDWAGTVLPVLGLCICSPYLLSMDASEILRELVQTTSGSGPSSTALCLACVAFDLLPASTEGERIMGTAISDLDPKLAATLVQQLLCLDEAASAMPGSRLFVDWKSSRSLTMVFDAIDQKEIHEQVLLHPPLGKAVSAYVHNRILHDRLLVAIQACISRGKQQLAAQLASQYYSERPVSTLTEDARCAEICLDSALDPNDPDDQTTTDLSSSSTPTGTHDISVAARKRLSKVSDGLRLEIFIRSRQAPHS